MLFFLYWHLAALSLPCDSFDYVLRGYLKALSSPRIYI